MSSGPFDGSFRLWSSALRLVGSGVHPGTTTFPHALVLAHWAKTPCDGAHLLPASTFSVPTITGGYARTGQCGNSAPGTRRPDCTSRRLRANRANWAGNWANRANWAGWAKAGPRPAQHLAQHLHLNQHVGQSGAKPTQTGPTNLGQPGPTPPSPAVQPSVPLWTSSPQRNVVDVFHGKWLYCVLEVLWNFDGLLKTL